MRYPFASISTALLMWIVIFIGSSLVFFKKPTAFLNIDADSINMQTSATRKNHSSQTTEKIIPITKEQTKINRENIFEPERSISQNAKASAIYSNQGAKPIYQPLPEIPEDLRDEAFATYAIAHFNISADGSATVKLIKPCENPRLNYLLLKSLKNWKFSPATNDKGEAIPSIQDIKVRFKVE